MMPLGIRCKAVLTPLMTKVWPALWPPWKRTTPCALSVSQSPSLPLPSSPHWVPTTTTFRPLVVFISLCFKLLLRPTDRRLAPIRGRTETHRLHSHALAAHTPRFRPAGATAQWQRARRVPLPKAHAPPPAEGAPPRRWPVPSHRG